MVTNKYKHMGGKCTSPFHHFVHPLNYKCVLFLSLSFQEIKYIHNDKLLYINNSNVKKFNICIELF